jgi:RNA polymerase sigma-70 factor (ECF subfamily)
MIRLSTWWSAARSERPTAERTSRIQAIAKAHLDAIWRTARDLGVDARDVEDVLQEVLLVVVRRIDDILVDRERAFVLAATARVVANWRRTRRRRPLELSDELDALGPVVGGSSGLPPGPERALEHSERLELLRVALAAMTEAQRVAFTLFELEQLTAREIAEQLGVPEAAVESRVRRAWQVFHDCCERTGEAESPEPTEADE